MWRAGEIVLSREEHANWLASTKQSALDLHTSNIIEIEQVVFIYKGIHICMYITTINEREKGGVYGKFGWEGEMI